MVQKKRLIFLATVTVALLFTAKAFSLETEGYASWYGPYFQGRLTANGEIFDTNKLTAAHKTLPFGSIVKVTNLVNHRSVVVRINDRGPYVEGRIIDLSHAAAEAIGMLNRGVVKVKLEVLHLQQQNSLRTIQVATFLLRQSAKDLEQRLEELGMKPALEQGNEGTVRVVLRSVPLAEIHSIQKELSQVGYPNTLIRLD